MLLNFTHNRIRDIKHYAEINIVIFISFSHFTINNIQIFLIQQNKDENGRFSNQKFNDLSVHKYIQTLYLTNRLYFLF